MPSLYPHPRSENMNRNDVHYRAQQNHQNLQRQRVGSFVEGEYTHHHQQRHHSATMEDKPSYYHFRPPRTATKGPPSPRRVIVARRRNEINNDRSAPYLLTPPTPPIIGNHHPQQEPEHERQQYATEEDNVNIHNGNYENYNDKRNLRQQNYDAHYQSQSHRGYVAAKHHHHQRSNHHPTISREYSSSSESMSSNVTNDFNSNSHNHMQQQQNHRICHEYEEQQQSISSFSSRHAAPYFPKFSEQDSLPPGCKNEMISNKNNIETIDDHNSRMMMMSRSNTDDLIIRPRHSHIDNFQYNSQTPSFVSKEERQNRKYPTDRQAYDDNNVYHRCRDLEATNDDKTEQQEQEEVASSSSHFLQNNQKYVTKTNYFVRHSVSHEEEEERNRVYSNHHHRQETIPTLKNHISTTSVTQEDKGEKELNWNKNDSSIKNTKNSKDANMTMETKENDDEKMAAAMLLAGMAVQTISKSNVSNSQENNNDANNNIRNSNKEEDSEKKGTSSTIFPREEVEEHKKHRNDNSPSSRKLTPVITADDKLDLSSSLIVSKQNVACNQEKDDNILRNQNMKYREECNYNMRNVNDSQVTTTDSERFFHAHQQQKHHHQLLLENQQQPPRQHGHKFHSRHEEFTSSSRPLDNVPSRLVHHQQMSLTKYHQDERRIPAVLSRSFNEDDISILRNKGSPESGTRYPKRKLSLTLSDCKDNYPAEQKERHFYQLMKEERNALNTNREFPRRRCNWDTSHYHHAVKREPSFSDNPSNNQQHRQLYDDSTSDTAPIAHTTAYTVSKRMRMQNPPDTHSHQVPPSPSYINHLENNDHKGRQHSQHHHYIMSTSSNDSNNYHNIQTRSSSDHPYQHHNAIEYTRSSSTNTNINFHHCSDHLSENKSRTQVLSNQTGLIANEVTDNNDNAFRRNAFGKDSFVHPDRSIDDAESDHYRHHHHLVHHHREDQDPTPPAHLRSTSRHRHYNSQEVSPRKSPRSRWLIQTSKCNSSSNRNRQHESSSSVYSDNTNNQESSYYCSPYDVSHSLTTSASAYHMEFRSFTSKKRTMNRQFETPVTPGAKVTILRRKCAWKNYPELEAFLIENREEYLKHSAMNYTIQQKQYNNRLTERLLEVAAKNGYIFDEADFNFVAVRDRIRCYYKSYVQSAKKRGIILGHNNKTNSYSVSEKNKNEKLDKNIKTKANNLSKNNRSTSLPPEETSATCGSESGKDVVPILDENGSDNIKKATSIQTDSSCTPLLNHEKLGKKGNLIPDDVSLNEDNDGTMQSSACVEH